MGVVYKGFHGPFAREVAVKFMTSTGASAHERFLREGRAAARVDHRHVIKVIDAGMAQGRVYLVMEFVDGRSLGDLLDAQTEQDRMLPPTDRPVGSFPNLAAVMQLGEQIARGLAAIHAAGIVHRDIKPDNVLVGHDGTAKVGDLGLAKAVEEPEALRLTGTGMVVGTPMYVSPEAIREPQSIAAPADIYCLGGTLYHLIAGRPPFMASTAYDVMRAHLEEKPVPLVQVRPGVPQDLARLVDRCLDKRPDRRPTAVQVAEALGTAGDRVGGNLGGVAAVGLIAAAVAGATMVGLWHLLAPSTEAVTVTVVPAQVRVLVNHPQAEVRIDQEAWQRVPEGPLPVPPGAHDLCVQVAGSGPLLRWSTRIEANPGAEATVAVTLAATPVPPVRVTLSGTGMAYRDGVAVGMDSQVVLDQVGTFHLGRWDGALWRTQAVEVDDRGQATPGTVQTSDRPDGPAWWRTCDDRLQPLPPHHVPCWWEVEAARGRRRLQPPPGWLMQQPRPADAAGPIPQLILAPLVEELTRSGGQLPSGDVATQLSGTYKGGLWAAGSPAVVVGAPTKSMGRIVLVP